MPVCHLTWKHYSTKCAIYYSEVNSKSLSRIVKHRSPTAKMQLPKSKMQLSHRRHFQLYIQFFQTDETIWVLSSWSHTRILISKHLSFLKSFRKVDNKYINKQKLNNKTKFHRWIIIYVVFLKICRVFTSDIVNSQWNLEDETLIWIIEL